MKSFWNGLAGIAKVLIIAVTAVLIAGMLSTCSLVGWIVG